MPDEMELYAAANLAIEGIALRRLDVRVENRLSDQIAVHLRAEDPAEIADVAFATRFGTLYVRRPGQEPRPRRLIDRLLGRRRASGDPAEADAPPGRPAPTLELDVRVPLCTDLTLRMSGSPEVRVGDLSGAFRFTVSEGVDLRAGAGLLASVAARDGARVEIARTEGDLDLDLRGAAFLRIGRAEAGSAHLRLRDAAVCAIESGEIADLGVSAEGGQAPIDALVTGDLSFSGRGSFDVALARVLGEVEASWSGGGSLRVGRPAAGEEPEAEPALTAA